MTPLSRSESGLTLPPVREVPVMRPLQWLAQGWRDFRGALVPSAAHGVVVAGGGLVIAVIALRYWYLLPGAMSGFMLVAPILATGLYELSRRIASGERPRMAHVIDAWRRGTRPLMWLGLMLAIAGTMWVLVSAVLVALFVTAPITGLESFVRHVILSQGSNLFPVWMMLGALGASVVFAGTVVSVPLLLDRDLDLMSAIITSGRAVAANPIAMGVWATIVMMVTALSMATLMLGFVIAIPVIGHATWHVYRDVVDASGLPPRG